MSFGAVVVGDVIFGTFDSGFISSVSNSLPMNWNSEQLVGQLVDINYSVAINVEVQFSINYDIVAAVEQDLEINWDQKGIAIDTLTINWSIDSRRIATITNNSFCPPKTNRIKKFCV